MWLHLGHFVGAIFGVFFDAIGTTMLGRIVDIAFAGSIATAVLYQRKRQGGWRAMIEHWRQEYRAGLKFAMWSAIIIYAPVLLWSLGKAVYQDHTGLATRLVAEKHQGYTKSLNDNREISRLTTDCAVKDGVNRTLQAQNRDQQNSVNGCLTQAIKLLAREPVTTILSVQPWGTTKRKGKETIIFVAMTNAVIGRARFTIKCEDAILSAKAFIIGASVMYGTPQPVTETTWEATVSGPTAWSQTTPIQIEVTHNDGEKFCNVTQ